MIVYSSPSLKNYPENVLCWGPTAINPITIAEERTSMGGRSFPCRRRGWPSQSKKRPEPQMHPGGGRQFARRDTYSPLGPLATMMQGEYWTNIHPWTPLATTVRGEFWTNIHPSGRPLRQRLAQVTDRGRGHQYGGCSDRCRIICKVEGRAGSGQTANLLRFL